MSRTNDSLKLIKAARLIDGRGGRPTNNGAILVEGNKIRAVGPLKDVTPPIGALPDMYDYPTQTIMPGMIDAHTHHNGFGDGRIGDDLDV